MYHNITLICLPDDTRLHGNKTKGSTRMRSSFCNKPSLIKQGKVYMHIYTILSNISKRGVLNQFYVIVPFGNEMRKKQGLLNNKRKIHITLSKAQLFFIRVLQFMVFGS